MKKWLCFLASLVLLMGTVACAGSPQTDTQKISLKVWGAREDPALLKRRIGADEETPNVRSAITAGGFPAAVGRAGRRLSLDTSNAMVSDITGGAVKP